MKRKYCSVSETGEEDPLYMFSYGASELDLSLGPSVLDLVPWSNGPIFLWYTVTHDQSF